MIAFIDDHRGAHGVEPISKVLPIAPSTYHAHVAKRRDPAEEEAQLLALLDEGMTATELGERLGRSRQAVYGRLQRFRKQRSRVSRTSRRAFAQWIG